MNIDDISIYLPKYLSPDSQSSLYENLRNFPDNIDKRIYASGLDSSIIYQGDGIKDLLIVNFSNKEIKETKSSIIISNTCDIDSSNVRFVPSQIVYAPIINLNQYRSKLLESNINPEKVNSHIEAIIQQRISNIFFLPCLNDDFEDSIVFLDRIYNIENDYIKRNQLNQKRIFSLSNYGFYLFIFKLSVHFTRLHESVDRDN